MICVIARAQNDMAAMAMQIFTTGRFPGRLISCSFRHVRRVSGKGSGHKTVKNKTMASSCKTALWPEGEVR